MKASGFGSTDVGNVRTVNEDRLFVSDELGLYVVCDGMGGHAAGEVAAQIATDVVADTVRASIEASMRERGHAPDHVEAQEILRQAIQAASFRISSEGSANLDCAGMGCTLTALQVVGAKAIMAHVGDTRLYLLRDGAVELLSSDHTYAADLVRRGEMTPSVARHHEYSHALTRCVGSQDAVQVDSLVLDLGPEDRFLICSDGLSGHVDSLSELAFVLGSADPASIPDELIRMANRRGGDDNVTVIAVVMRAPDREMERWLALSEQRSSDLRLLRRMEIFREIGFADALRILDRSQVVTCRSGEVVHEPHERAGELCLVLSGSFELSAGSQVLRVLRPGDHIGDTALLVSRSRVTRLVAKQDGRLLTLTAERLHELAQRRPWLGVKILTSLATVLSGELSAAGSLVEANAQKPADSGSIWQRLRESLLRR